MENPAQKAQMLPMLAKVLSAAASPQSVLPQAMARAGAGATPPPASFPGANGGALPSTASLAHLFGAGAIPGLMPPPGGQLNTVPMPRAMTELPMPQGGKLGALLGQMSSPLPTPNPQRTSAPTAQPTPPPDAFTSPIPRDRPEETTTMLKQAMADPKRLQQELASRGEDVAPSVIEQLFSSPQVVALMAQFAVSALQGRGAGVALADGVVAAGRATKMAEEAAQQQAALDRQTLESDRNFGLQEKRVGFEEERVGLEREKFAETKKQFEQEMALRRSRLAQGAASGAIKPKDLLGAAVELFAKEDASYKKLYSDYSLYNQKATPDQITEAIGKPPTLEGTMKKIQETLKAPREESITGTGEKGVGTATETGVVNPAPNMGMVSPDRVDTIIKEVNMGPGTNNVERVKTILGQMGGVISLKEKTVLQKLVETYGESAVRQAGLELMRRN